jgi:hypothetical protein
LGEGFEKLFARGQGVGRRHATAPRAGGVF